MTGDQENDGEQPAEEEVKPEEEQIDSGVVNEEEVNDEPLEAEQHDEY